MNKLCNTTDIQKKTKRVISSVRCDSPTYNNNNNKTKSYID